MLNWCALRLPVARVIEQHEGVLIVSNLPGSNLTEDSFENVVNAVADALTLIHAVPIDNCPFSASWSLRPHQAKQRIEAGLVD